MKLMTCVLVALGFTGCLTMDPGLERRGKVTGGPPTVYQGYYPINGQYHPVTYEYVNGSPQTGGDILLDPEKLLKMLPTYKDMARASAAVASSRWPSRFIPVFIDVPDIPQNYAFLDTVYNAIMQYNSNTNVYFNIISEAPETGAYVKIIQSSAGDMASVGYLGANLPHTVLLQPTTSVGSTVHELGHILGLHHEHQRPDRDLYLTMIYRNWCGHPDVARIDTRARQGRPYNDTGIYDCKDWAINMAIREGATGYGPLDFKSIMLYSSSNLRFSNPSYGHFDQPTSNSPFIGPAFDSVMPGLRPGWGYPTMIRKGYDFETEDSAYFFGNSQFSSQDIATINSMFPTEPPRVGWIDVGNCAETPLQILQEDENTGNASSARYWQYSDTPGPPYTWHTASDGIHRYIGPTTIIDICPEERTTLPVLRDDYAVLKLSADCPLNSFAFSRTADNENTTNSNAATGDISPSSTIQGGSYMGSTTLHFCFVPGDGAVNPAPQPTPPWYGLKAGAFTHGAFTDLENSDCYYHHNVQDDEDTNNAFASGSSYSFEAGAEQFESRIKLLFSNVQTETHYRWHVCR